MRCDWTIRLFLTTMVTISIALISTLYPVYLIKKDQLKSISYKQQSSMFNHSQSSLNHAEFETIPVGVQSLCEVIANYNSFKALMSHLISEFSTENLLFLVELVQCKYEYQKRHNFKIQISESIDKNEFDECILIDFTVNIIPF